MIGSTEDVEVALNTHPLCRKIAQFLIAHEGVMDTIDGIAKCWVDSDAVAVKSALERLQSAGVVATQILSSGTYFRLTTNSAVRDWLKAHFANCPLSPRVLSIAGSEAEIECGAGGSE